MSEIKNLLNTVKITACSRKYHFNPIFFNEKIYLFVDGSNLYGGQYELFRPKKYLNFSKFIKRVEE